MRWFDKLRNNTLGLICILALIAFHLDDAINGKFLFPLNNWLHSFKLSTISMDSEDHEWWHFQFPATQGEGKELEPAHQWLSWVGLHIRAQCNETRQRWVNYSHDGRRFYYLRDEFDFQYERKSPQVEKVYKEIIELMHQVVEKSGATLVVAPMPTKTSIYRDRLPQSLQEQKLWQPYRNHRNMKEDSYLVYQGALKGAPSDTVDVYRAFKNYHSEHPDRKSVV